MKILMNIVSRIQSLAKESDRAIFHVDLGYILHQHLRWKKLFPRVLPYYAVKCQPDSRVINLLSRIGVHFDCCSQGEMEKVLTNVSSIKKSKIMFSNPFKFRKDMQFASEIGVELTSFDSIGELERLKQIWPTAKLMLRIGATNSKEEIRSLSNTEKFGAKLYNIPLLLEKAKEMNFDVVGLSFHAGIMCEDWTAWSKALEKSFEAKQIMNEHGINPQIINIGGGFPGISIYDDDISKTKNLQYEDICKEFNKLLNEIYPEKDDYTIVSTPGTHYVYGAYTLATQILGKRQIEFDSGISIRRNRELHFGNLHTSNLVSAVKSVIVNDNSLIKEKRGYVYIIDDGVYGSFNNLMFADYTFILLDILEDDGYVKKFLSSSKRYKSKVYGPTCDTFDCIFPEIYMPELETDDWLIWADMGAYSNASRTDFNGIVSPEIVYYMSPDDENLVKEIENDKPT